MNTATETIQVNGFHFPIQPQPRALDMNITAERITDALDVKGKSTAKLKNAIQDALEASPAEEQDTYRRHYASHLAADNATKSITREIAFVFMADAIKASPVVNRNAVDAAVTELIDV